MIRKSNALVVFIKNPQKGKVKTRIASTVGEENALEIYKQLLDHTLSNTSGENWDTLLFLSDFIEDLPQYTFEKRLQARGDLGVKLHAAFEETLLQYEKCITIGSDCPYINAENVQEGFDSLNQNDVVLGPTLDGGYYLIGLSKPYKSLFDEIAWSTESVLNETVAAANKSHFSIHFLPTLSDVDHASDWDEYLIHLATKQ